LVVPREEKRGQEETKVRGAGEEKGTQKYGFFSDTNEMCDRDL